jgi:hypothetical protein
MFLSLERRQTCFAISCVCDLSKFSSIERALEENIHAKGYFSELAIIELYERGRVNHLLQMSLLSARNNCLKRFQSHYNI